MYVNVCIFDAISIYYYLWLDWFIKAVAAITNIGDAFVRT